MIYNRKKRNEFFVEQKAKHQAAIHDARLAINNGIATEDQIAFITREEEEEARLAKLKQKKSKGIFKSAKTYLFAGLRKDEQGEDIGTSEARLGYESMSEEDDSLGERESDVVRAIEDKNLAIQNKARQAFAEEKTRERNGGPLDRIGASPNDTDARSGEEPPRTSWTSFFTRR